jgi:hypothetical protein
MNLENSYICLMAIEHNGMRPQDIVVLLKIVAVGHQGWQSKDLAAELFLSPAEISYSLHRSDAGRLIDYFQSKTVYRQALMEFIEHGLPYVFPAMPGTMVNGVYTAHSHPFMQKHFSSELNYAWPYPKGEVRGLAIKPLYPGQVKAALGDPKLYLMLALLDVIRVGRVREMKVAIEELKNQLL